MLAYWDYHVNGHGWDDIGYNWVVDPNGVLYKGRAWKSETEENVQGAHNSAKNGNTSGICLIGNYVSSTPSDEGLDKLASICAFLCNKYEINPLGTSYHESIGKVNDNITGHGQSGGGTSCPGTQMINRMQTLRDATNTKNYDITSAPNIMSSYPSSVHDSVYLSKDIVIEFSLPMNTSSVESAFSIVPDVSGEFSWNDEERILNYKPTADLLPKTNYTLTISQESKSKWDIPLDNDVELNFVTKASDNLSLISTLPTDGAIDVARDVTIELVFDAPINGNSLGGNIFFRDSNSLDVNLNVDATDYDSGIIRFTPFTSLDENSSYYIELKENISSTDNYSFGRNKIINFTTGTITSVDTDSQLPENIELYQNYPNPFNPTTRISYSLPSVASSFSLRNVTLKVYDVLGKEVKTLVDKNQPAGQYNVNLDATSLPSGVYYYQLKAGDIVETKKMILLK